MAARQVGAFLLALALGVVGGASAQTITVNAGDIPANKTVTVVFNAQVNPGFSGTPSQVLNQGSISGSNFATVVTDDPSTGAASDPTITPIQVPTVTAIASNFNPSVFSQSVTFTATVTSNSGTPTGTVNFVIDGGAPIPIVLNGSGQASISTTALTIAGSPHSVVATFIENAGFGPSSATLTPGQTVLQASSQTAVGSSANPSVAGQPVIFTATVTGLAPATGRPATGTVQFIVDGSNVGSPVAINGAGVASSAPVTLFAVGSPHTILATFTSTDANFGGSSGSLAGGQAVNKANTVSTLTGDVPDPSATGQLVTVTYVVSVVGPGAGAPTGNVLVSDGVDSCTGTVAAGTCSLALTTVGPRSLTATYQSDSNYNTSTSAPLAHTVQKADTTAAITNESVDPTVAGEAFTVSYTVSPVAPGAGVPTGNVLVTDGVNSCTGTVAAGGCSIALVTVGARNLTATYQGDARFNASPASPAAPHMVNKASTTAAVLTDTPDPSVYGAPVAVTYAVSVVAPGSGTPTGNVLVTDGVDSCTNTVAAGSCNLTLTTIGLRTITATYQGDANFNASPPSPGVAHLVNKANTVAVILTDTPDPTMPGDAVLVTFQVAPMAPATGTPTGNVTVTDGSADSCLGTLGPAGTGICSVTLNTTGLRQLTATYAGDANFNPTTSANEPHLVLNRPPVVNDQTLGPVPQVAANGTVVGTVAASDPDPGQTLSYAITGGNTGGAFVINPATGQITVANSAAVVPANAPFLLSVQVTDNGSPALSDTATVTINILPVTLTISDVTQVEGDSGTSLFVFTVTVTGTVSAPVTVNYTTLDGSALSASDYVATSGALTFNPGGPSQLPVVVQVNGDVAFENAEVFTVELSGATGAGILDPSGTGTITNDDGQPVISIGNVTRLEGGDSGTAPATFSVLLSGPSGLPVTVQYDTVNGTALAGTDFVGLTAQTLTFNPGVIVMPVDVLVNGDPFSETTKRFVLRLSNPSGATLGADVDGDGTIVDDDPAWDPNNDGRADILWQHATNGSLGSWFLDGVNLIGGGPLVFSGVIDPQWRISTIGDFDGDGKSDLVWQYLPAGTLGMWLMDGSTLVQSVVMIPPVLANPDWRLRGAGDFDGDGKRDLVLQHPSGPMEVWRMDGNTRLAVLPVTPTFGPNSGWEIAGVVDVDQDLKPDFLLQNVLSGNVAVWFMNGATAQGSTYLSAQNSDPNWRVVSVADVNRDGNMDLIWRHKVTGDLATWTLDGTTLTGGSYLNPQTVSDPNWLIVGAR